VTDSGAPAQAPKPAAPLPRPRRPPRSRRLRRRRKRGERQGERETRRRGFGSSLPFSLSPSLLVFRYPPRAALRPRPHRDRRTVFLVPVPDATATALPSGANSTCRRPRLDLQAPPAHEPQRFPVRHVQTRPTRFRFPRDACFPSGLYASSRAGGLGDFEIDRAGPPASGYVPTSTRYGWYDCRRISARSVGRKRELLGAANPARKVVERVAPNDSDVPVRREPISIRRCRCPNRQRPVGRVPERGEAFQRRVPRVLGAGRVRFRSVRLLVRKQGEADALGARATRPQIGARAARVHVARPVAPPEHAAVVQHDDRAVLTGGDRDHLTRELPLPTVELPSARINGAERPDRC